MKVKIEDVYELDGKGFVTSLRLPTYPKVGSMLGKHKVVEVSMAFTCCFGCMCKDGHKDLFFVVTKTKPEEKEELELT